MYVSKMRERQEMDCAVVEALEKYMILYCCLNTHVMSNILPRKAKYLKSLR
jgi:translation initiation factor IF-1